MGRRFGRFGRIESILKVPPQRHDCSSVLVATRDGCKYFFGSLQGRKEGTAIGILKIC